MKPFKDKLSTGELDQLVRQLRRGQDSIAGSVELNAIYLLRCNASHQDLLVRFTR